MSSKYVRDLATQWAANCVTPFFATVNNVEEPVVYPWFTIDFIVFDTVKETYCDDKEEAGTLRLLFLGQPGNGYESLFAVAESDSLIFYQSVDPTGALTLELKNAPQVFGGSDTPHFGVEVSIDYSYRP